MAKVREFGEFEIAPKKDYLSLRRAKQFACLTPAMKTRLDDLPNRNRDDSVVVYLAGSALVDHDGKVQILANDSKPYEPGTGAPAPAKQEAPQQPKRKQPQIAALLGGKLKRA